VKTYKRRYTEADKLRRLRGHVFKEIEKGAQDPYGMYEGRPGPNRFLMAQAKQLMESGASPSEAWGRANVPTHLGYAPGEWEAATPKERWQDVKLGPGYGMSLGTFEDPNTGMPRKTVGNYWDDVIGALVYGSEMPEPPKIPRVSSAPGQSTDVTATADIVRDVQRGSGSGANIVVGDVDIKNYENLQEQLSKARTQEERDILQGQINANDISRQQQAFIEDYRRRYGFDPDPSAVAAAMGAIRQRGRPNVDWWG
jgi:hypothetical protein